MPRKKAPGTPRIVSPIVVARDIITKRRNSPRMYSCQPKAALAASCSNPARNASLLSAGLLGLPQRSDYTAIGDTVNTASRLESLCKEYHVDSVVSADAAALLDGDTFKLTRLGTTAIRGKEQEVEVFTLATA